VIFLLKLDIYNILILISRTSIVLRIHISYVTKCYTSIIYPTVLAIGSISEDKPFAWGFCERLVTLRVGACRVSISCV